MNILVTGGAGYIGSHACKALSAAGFMPITFDNLSTGHTAAVQWGPLHQGDLLDKDAIEAVLSQYSPVAVMHFAASALVGESTREPGLYFRNNTIGSLNLIEAAHAHGIRALVFSSTCATYGVVADGLVDEEAPQRPINPYGASKLAVEHILEGFDVAHGLRSVALRYFNAAGASPEGDIGEIRAVETHLTPLAIDAALGVRPPLLLHGDDYPTADGTAVRDYVHVSDLADAHVLALRHLLSGGDSLRLNLGTGQGASVRDVLLAVAEVVGRAPPYTIGPRRPGDPPALVADPRRAQVLLGWTPRLSDLPTIISTAAQWHRKVAASNGTFPRPAAAL